MFPLGSWSLSGALRACFSAMWLDEESLGEVQVGVGIIFFLFLAFFFSSGCYCCCYIDLLVLVDGRNLWTSFSIASFIFIKV